MAFDELTPLLQELSQNPVAFLGGFMAGVLRLNLADDPVKSWIENQGGSTPPSPNSPSPKKPQSISID